MERPVRAHHPEGVPEPLGEAPATTLVGLLEAAWHTHARRPAWRFHGRTTTFAEVDALTRDFAAWLRGCGLARGERVALLLPNVPQFGVAALGALRAGLVVVPLDPQAAPRELAHQLADSGASLVVVLELHAATLQQVLPALNAPRVVVASLGDLLGPLRGRLANQVQRRVRKAVPAYQLPDAVPFAQALREGRARPLADEGVGPEDIALLPYTGGTTGVSKGAVLRHRQLAANVEQCRAWCRPMLDALPPQEAFTALAALPWHHVFGFTVSLLLGLRTGACNVLVADPGDADALMQALTPAGVHLLPGVNTMFEAILRHPGVATVDWSRLRLCVGGAMAVGAETARRWHARTGRPIIQGYGLTEASPVVTCCPVDAPAFDGSIGCPLPGTEVELRDEAGAPLPPGQPGELCVRGPQVMAGYWHQPDETARVMTADAFLRTGDIAQRDARGVLRLVGRRKDLIIVSGFKVYPVEVEEVALRLPGVREAVAVGMHDALTGEAVRLLLVRDDPALTAEAVQAWCEAQLSGHKRPRVVEFRDALPRSAAGIVLRRELRA